MSIFADVLGIRHVGRSDPGIPVHPIRTLEGSQSAWKRIAMAGIRASELPIRRAFDARRQTPRASRSEAESHRIPEEGYYLDRELGRQAALENEKRCKLWRCKN
jgi:hypothetical protein